MITNLDKDIRDNNKTQITELAFKEVVNLNCPKQVQSRPASE